MAQGPGSITVDPQSAPEGSTVQVGFDGEGALYASVDFGDWVEVPIDPTTGKGQFEVPVGSQVIGFSNRKGISSIGATIEVVSTSSP